MPTNIPQNIIKRLLWFVVLFFILNTGKTSAQSTMGTDFWVTFLPNSDDPDVTLSLIAAGARPCTGVVTNPRTNYSQSFSVTPGITTTVPIIKAQAYNFNGSDCIQNTALHVVTTDTISLYASNFKTRTFDVTDVLPTQSLGSDYILQTFVATFKSGDQRDLDHDYSTFSILAIENQTQVNITLSNNSLNGHFANTPFSVTLNAGECYQMKSSEFGDFSGTHIAVADNKKIAVFAGNQCAYVPSGYGFADHLVEQMMPTTCWGQHFVISNTMLRSRDIIRVTALNDHCQIKKNGVVLTTINARQTYQFEISSNAPSAYLETSEPAMVFLYLTGSEYAGENGDPSMVLVSPIEQGIYYVTFSTFNSGNSQYHYVNIVTNTDQVSGMRLDANSIASQFQPVSGNSNYSFARVQVSHGSHTLYNQDGVFVAHVYGLGDHESYGYSVGSMAINLTSQMLVNGQSITEHPNGFVVCANDDIDFALNLNYTFSHVDWTFGDGETGSGSPVTHSFNAPGDYPVSCDIYTIEEGLEILVSTLTTVIHVGASYQETIYETHCGSYQWFGQTYTQSGEYQHLLQTTAGCDSLLVLNLTIGTGQVHPVETVTNCESYDWHNNHYTVSGIYHDTIQDEAGCEDVYTLDLTIAHNVYPDTVANVCDEFLWHGQTYNQSGIYEYHDVTSLGCDSIVKLHLSVEYSPDLVIHGLSQVAMTSHYGPFYNYFIADSLELSDCVVTWECSNDDWIMIVNSSNPYKCQIAPISLGPATLKATAHCDTGCDTEYNFEIYASHYDVGENKDNKILLFPNPADRQVTVQVPQLTHIRILNCFGQAMKALDYDQVEAATLDVGNLPRGIYFLEITTAKGQTMKSLIIQ